MMRSRTTYIKKSSEHYATERYSFSPISAYVYGSWASAFLLAWRLRDLLALREARKEKWWENRKTLPEDAQGEDAGTKVMNEGTRCIEDES